MTRKILFTLTIGIACALPSLAQEPGKSDAKQADKQMQGTMGQPTGGQMT